MPSYSNNAFLDGVSGRLNIIKLDSLNSIVIVHYRNKFQVVGRLKNGKEEGLWSQYDNKGRLRKKVIFMNGSATQIIRFSKRGKLIYKSNTSIDF